MIGQTKDRTILHTPVGILGQLDRADAGDAEHGDGGEEALVRHVEREAFGDATPREILRMNQQ